MIFPFAWIFLQALSPAWSADGGSSSAPRVFTLEQAIGFAVEHSPTLDSAKRTQQIGEMAYQSATAKLLPSLDLSTTNGLQNNIVTSLTQSGTTNPNPPWSSALSLGLTENLYDNGATLTQRRIAAWTSDEDQLGFIKARDSLALGIMQSYYQYSLARRLVDIQTELEQALTREFKTVESEFQQGLKTKSDFLRLKAQVTRAQIDRINDGAQVDQTANDLRRQMGIPSEDTTEIAFEPLTVEDAPLIFPQSALDIHLTYEYRLAKIQNQVNAETVDLTRRLYYPQVAATAGLVYANYNYLGSTSSFSTTAGLTWDALVTVTYNFWDWGIRRRNLETAEMTQNIQDDALETGLLQTRSDEDVLSGNLKRAAETLAMNRELVRDERNSYLHVESQYHDGKLTYLDLVGGLNDLQDAQVRYATAYFQALGFLAQYHYFEGTVYGQIPKR